MKILAAAVTAGLLLALPAAAQDKPTTPATSAAPTTPAAGTSPSTSPPSKPTAATVPTGKQVLDECRDAALAKGLDEAARRKAIATCVINANPKIARRIRCLMNPKLRTMDKDARTAAITECIEGGQ